MGYRKPIELTQPIWKRQPGESLTAYTRFYWYLRQPIDDPRYTARNGRTLSYVADKATVNIKGIEDLAGTYHWDLRADAYDQHEHADRIQRSAQELAEHEHALARDEVMVAREILTAVRTGVRTLMHQGGQIAPQELAILADAATALHNASQRRATPSATGEPEHPEHTDPAPPALATPAETTGVQLSALDITSGNAGGAGAAA